MLILVEHAKKVGAAATAEHHALVLRFDDHIAEDVLVHPQHRLRFWQEQGGGSGRRSSVK